eukprot:4626811-Prymnesium_polylepis.1
MSPVTPRVATRDAATAHRAQRGTAARRGSATGEGPTPRGVPSSPRAPGLGGEALSPGTRRPRVRTCR